VLLVVSVIGSFWIRGTAPQMPAAGTIPAALRRCVLLAAWVSLAVYCMKSGMTTTARLISPYYPLLLPLLLIGAAQSEIVRRWWWRGLVAGVLFFAFVVVIVVPDRPLWPAKTILTKIHERQPGQPLVNRALKVYTVYADRWDSLAGVRTLLPPGTTVVGFLGGVDDCDISLWRPFFERRVEHFQLADSPEKIRERAEYVVVSETAMAGQGVPFNEWLQKSGATVIASTNAMLKVSAGAQSWQIVRFEK